MSKKEDLIKTLVNKMLEMQGDGYTFDYVLANPKINGKDWFSDIQWDQTKEDEFRIWAEKEIKSTLKITKKKAKLEFSWFSLMYGLKVK